MTVSNLLTRSLLFTAVAIALTQTALTFPLEPANLTTLQLGNLNSHISFRPPPPPPRPRRPEDGGRTRD